MAESFRRSVRCVWMFIYISIGQSWHLQHRIYVDVHWSEIQRNNSVLMIANVDLILHMTTGRREKQSQFLMSHVKMICIALIHATNIIVVHNLWKSFNQCCSLFLYDRSNDFGLIPGNWIFEVLEVTDYVQSRIHQCWSNLYMLLTEIR